MARTNKKDAWSQKGEYYMEVTRVATLITCHNRCEETLSSLSALFGQDMPPEVTLEVYLVDDGSADGTTEAVRAAFPKVTVLQGNGSLFWSGGMRVAFSEALKGDYDYYLWLNDDTLLYRDALVNLLRTHCNLCERGRLNSVIVGSTRDVVNSSTTYGGVVRTNRWRPLKFQLIEPKEEPQECETMNGNCVLVPRIVAKKVGNLSGAFTHGIGDYDYGLRARKLGCSVWVAPGHVGYCSRNSIRGSWTDTSLSLRERLKKREQAKGLPAGEWRTFARRHAGLLWFFYWVYGYMHLFGSSVLQRVRERIAQEGG